MLKNNLFNENEEYFNSIIKISDHIIKELTKSTMKAHKKQSNLLKNKKILMKRTMPHTNYTVI